jgi:isopenicillin-N epimerase
VQFKRPAHSPFRKYWAFDRGLVFLNHGSFGACPKPVLAMQSALRKEMEASPVRFLWRLYETRLQPARTALANFLGANQRDLVFVSNATTAVNAVARSWKLRRGDEILTTNLDYNACRNVLAEVAKAAGAKVVVATIPFPIRHADDLVGTILSCVTPRTRYAMIDHVTSGSALVLPVARIVRELETRGIDTLVDGAHGPGMLSLNLRNLRPAWYCGNLHKWVCAPKGSAFLWAREDQQGLLQPAVVSHGNNCPRRGFSSFQDRFDWAGTFDPSAWFCVPDAIRWLGGLLPDGWSGLRRRNHELALDARELLCAALEVEAPCPAGMIGSMATIPLPERFQGVRFTSKIAPEQERLYDECRIEVPFVKIGDLRCFRVSAQIYNTPAEYAFLAGCIHRLRERRIKRKIEP